MNVGPENRKQKAIFCIFQKSDPEVCSTELLKGSVTGLMPWADSDNKLSVTLDWLFSLPSLTLLTPLFLLLGLPKHIFMPCSFFRF